MLKQSIQWEGFNGRTMNKTLYFNLTRFEVAHDMELEVLESRFKKFQEEVVGDDPNHVREMTTPEVREMLDIVKTLIKHAYGERSPDGVKFTKNEEIWNDFVDTGAFDAFVWYLFEDPARANNFMNGIWPKEMQEAAAKVRAERPDIRPVADDETGEIPPVAPDDDGIPSISSAPSLKSVRNEKEWYEYSEGELLEMDDNLFETLYAESRAGKNVPPIMLNVRYKRQRNVESGDTTE